MTHVTTEQRTAWQRDGFFVMPSWLALSQVTELSAACEHVLRQVRASSASEGHTSTHVAELLAPHCFSDRPEALQTLSELVSSRAVIQCVAGLGGPLEGDLQLRSVQLFHEPSGRDQLGAWHRDGDEIALPTDVLPDAASAGTRGTQLRFRIALAPDDHLEYVPGSHKRADTPQELQVRRGHVRNAALPSPSVRIVLQPGDACVFDTWGIHRGRYRHGSERRTLDLVFGFGVRSSRIAASVRELGRWRR